MENEKQLEDARELAHEMERQSHAFELDWAMDQLSGREIDHIRTDQSSCTIVFTGGVSLKTESVTRKYFSDKRKITVVSLDGVPIFESY